jgi:hypothetical protein
MPGTSPQWAPAGKRSGRTPPGPPTRTRPKVLHLPVVSDGLIDQVHFFQRHRFAHVSTPIPPGLSCHNNTPFRALRNGSYRLNRTSGHFPIYQDALVSKTILFETVFRLQRHCQYHSPSQSSLMPLILRLRGFSSVLPLIPAPVAHPGIVPTAQWNHSATKKLPSSWARARALWNSSASPELSTDKKRSCMSCKRAPSVEGVKMAS